MTTGQRHQTGYRKNWGRWIAIYLAVGAILYALVYLFLLRGGGGGAGGGGY